MKSITRDLSEFICSLMYQNITERAVERVKASILDSLGCALSGSGFAWAIIVNGFIQSQQGVEEATLWGTRFIGPAANVVLGNGTMIHSFDFDDYHMTKIHPGAVVIPAAMACGEKEHIDGKRLLSAVVAGFETMTHISRGLNPAASRQRGWHLTGTCGTFAAAAAAGKIWELDPDRLVAALGMAGTQSSGLWAFTADGSDSKRFHPGRASQSGIIAASLARDGYKGPARILEADDGGLFHATSHSFDFKKVTEGLGLKYDSEDVGLKPHSACASLHSSIDIVLSLKKEHDIRPEEVETIRVCNSGIVDLQCGFDYRPMGALQAQMSMKYCMARALMDGMLYVSQFSNEKLSDPAVVELAGRVEFVRDDEIDRIYPREFPGRVEIVMRNGAKFEGRVENPKGSVQYPMKWPEVCRKFNRLTETVIGASERKMIIQKVENLETLKDVSALTALLRKG